MARPGRLGCGPGHRRQQCVAQHGLCGPGDCGWGLQTAACCPRRTHAPR